MSAYQPQANCDDAVRRAVWNEFVRRFKQVKVSSVVERALRREKDRQGSSSGATSAGGTRTRGIVSKDPGDIWRPHVRLLPEDTAAAAAPGGVAVAALPGSRAPLGYVRQHFFSDSCGIQTTSSAGEFLNGIDAEKFKIELYGSCSDDLLWSAEVDQLNRPVLNKGNPKPQLEHVFASVEAFVFASLDGVEKDVIKAFDFLQWAYSTKVIQGDHWNEIVSFVESTLLTDAPANKPGVDPASDEMKWNALIISRFLADLTKQKITRAASFRMWTAVLEVPSQSAAAARASAQPPAQAATPAVVPGQAPVAVAVVGNPPDPFEEKGRWWQQVKKPLQTMAETQTLIEANYSSAIKAGAKLVMYSFSENFRITLAEIYSFPLTGDELKLGVWIRTDTAKDRARFDKLESWAFPIDEQMLGILWTLIHYQCICSLAGLFTIPPDAPSFATANTKHQDLVSKAFQGYRIPTRACGSQNQFFLEYVVEDKRYSVPLIDHNWTVRLECLRATTKAEGKWQVDRQGPPKHQSALRVLLDWFDDKIRGWPVDEKQIEVKKKELEGVCGAGASLPGATVPPQYGPIKQLLEIMEPIARQKGRLLETIKNFEEWITEDMKRGANENYDYYLRLLQSPLFASFQRASPEPLKGLTTVSLGELGHSKMYNQLIPCPPGFENLIDAAYRQDSEQEGMSAIASEFESMEGGGGSSGGSGGPEDVTKLHLYLKGREEQLKMMSQSMAKLDTLRDLIQARSEEIAKNIMDHHLVTTIRLKNLSPRQVRDVYLATLQTYAEWYDLSWKGRIWEDESLGQSEEKLSKKDKSIARGIREGMAEAQDSHLITSAFAKLSDKRGNFVDALNKIIALDKELGKQIFGLFQIQTPAQVSDVLGKELLTIELIGLLNSGSGGALSSNAQTRLALLDLLSPENKNLAQDIAKEIGYFQRAKRLAPPSKEAFKRAEAPESQRQETQSLFLEKLLKNPNSREALVKNYKPFFQQG